jgi:hypothetical protein
VRAAVPKFICDVTKALCERALAKHTGKHIFTGKIRRGPTPSTIDFRFILGLFKLNILKLETKLFERAFLESFNKTEKNSLLFENSHSHCFSHQNNGFLFGLHRILLE